MKLDSKIEIKDNLEPVDISIEGATVKVSSQGVEICEDCFPEYIGGASGGIPCILFDIGSNISGSLQGRSDRMLDYYLKPNHLTLIDQRDPYFHFDAFIEGGELYLDIYTKRENFRHPDFYPFKLVKYVCEWFNSNGYIVEYLSDLWIDGDNLSVYWENINKGYTTEAAALLTWTGLLARSLFGMNRALVIEESLNKVRTTFYNE